jgi:membrane associated rhomboid family serine protease
VLNRVAGPRDVTPLRQPIFNIPGAVLATLLILVGVHLARQIIPGGWDDALFKHLAFVPERLTFAIAPDRVHDSWIALAEQGGTGYRQTEVERFVLGDGSLQPWTMVSYALLHADWAHIGLNAVWLLAFGSPVARRFGGGRFVAFLAVTAWMGALVQWAAHPLDFIPVIGASAAVSGCMGASLRFMFQPHVPMAAIIDTAAEGRGEAFVQPALSIRRTLTERRAVTFIVAWFVTNLLFGLGSLSFGLAGGPIAWQAHIGGFAAGLLLFGLFDPVRLNGEVEAETSPEPAVDV